MPDASSGSSTPDSSTGSDGSHASPRDARREDDSAHERYAPPSSSGAPTDDASTDAEAGAEGREHAERGAERTSPTNAPKAKNQEAKKPKDAASRKEADGERAGSKQADGKGVFGVVKEAFSEFSDDNCTTMAAAVAYYTIFSLPPLLIIIITVAGLFLSPQQVEQTIQQQAGGLVGDEGAQQIQTMIENAGNLGDRGPLGLIVGVAGLLFGATGAFAQLQTALNRAWEIKPDPEGSGIVFMIIKRILSLSMVLGIAFLLLVSLVLSAALSALSGWLAQFMPGGISSVALFVLDAAVSLAVITLLFAAIFKVLPDAKIAWSDVWMGGFVTALLFVAGKFAIGFYLGKSNPGEAFGAAGSLALILVWVYYSAIIIFLGAEFTQSWSKHRGGGIEPDSDAVRMRDGAVTA